MWKFVALAACGASQPWCPAAETTVESVHAFTTLLSSADLLDAVGTRQSLRELGLLAVPDILRLDAAESAEMASSLRGAGVTLGDRSRLRELAHSHRVQPALPDRRAAGGGSSSDAPQAAARLRALQERKSESSSLSVSGCVYAALPCAGVCVLKRPS